MSFKTILTDAINEMAKKGFIFSNESQFQFNLAWQLQQKGFDVLFEVLAAPVKDFANFSSYKGPKAYIDLVVKNKNNDYFAIELKYKVPQKNLEYKTNLGKMHTFSQGAPDEGAFLFWKDVERLELLGTDKLVLNFNPTINIKNKYAILLTNDKKYWEGNDKSLCKEFFPKDHKLFEHSLCWHVLLDPNTNQRVSGRSKRDEKITHKITNLADAQTHCYLNGKKKPIEPIFIKQQHYCEWNPYPCAVGKQPEFKYLILEI
jgi:hypothetical protein